MTEMYGISSAVNEANSLHGQIALQRENQELKYGIALKKFNDGIKNARANDKSVNDSSILGNTSDIQKAYNVGSGVYGGVSGAMKGAKATQTLAVAGRTGSDFLAESGAAMRGEDVVGGGLSGAAKGFVSGVSEAGGAAKDFSSVSKIGGLSGVEGIVQKGIIKTGGGEALGLVGGKVAGAAGGILDVGDQIDSLIDTGGKSAETRTNAAGKQVKLSKTDEAGQGLTEVGAALDVAATFTGGLLAPLAAAVSLAGAVTSGVGSIEDEKTDNKAAGLTSGGKVDASKRPKQGGAPISEAFTSLGFVGNQSHNPLAHIS
tara:strand:+ start:792 stop:1742 length:951 start_codon:yes stop_codon:yes gene_type:complete